VSLAEVRLWGDTIGAVRWDADQGLGFFEYTPEFRRDGRNIRFLPVARLAPGAQAVWELTVRAIDEGDVRFELEMTSREKQRPIRETESTTLYN